MLDIQAWAKQASEATRKMPHWEPDDGTDSSQWGSIVGHHRDSTLLEKSNWNNITYDMRESFPGDFEIVRFRHWGAGWVEEGFVRLWDAQGRITPAAEAGFRWMTQLADYPVANDEDYSRMEYEVTLSNIEEVGRGLVSDKAPKDWAAKVFSWFWDNDQGAVESVDDQGGYPTEDQMRTALEALGWLEQEDD